MKRTFTRKELLAAMACICLLLAILAPLILGGREATRRLSCANNLRILGLGVHNHHDQFKQLPHGGVSWNYPPRFIDEVAQVKEQQFAGWGFQLKPFLEQSQPFIPFPSEDESAINAISEIKSEYYCPGRRTAKAKKAVQAWYGPEGIYSHGSTDYAVANMDGDNGVFMKLKLDRKENPITVVGGLEIITDGTSNVLLFGEKRLALRELLGYPFDDNEGHTAGWDCDTVRGTGNIQADPITIRRPLPDFLGWGDGDCRFGSSHPKGFNIAFADASIRFIAYDIDGELFARLGCRDDGARIQVPD